MSKNLVDNARRRKIYNNRLGLHVEGIDKKICKSCNIEIMTVGELKSFKCPKCGMVVD